ncbi:MAG: exopolysaccharide biosynthesis polyprenyl glycosylphosphotransferase [Flavobacteriales bacterium]|nr:exopolysaccharide biosynthesis polyprenyl glycosylphosphotransferase [Flavobacteriales bacterium]
MYKNHEYLLSLYYRVIDLVGLNIAFFLGIYFRFYLSELLGLEEKLSFSFIDNEYASLLLFINITWLFISNSQKIYSLQSFVSKNRYVFAVTTAIVLQFLITIAFNGLIKTFYSRIFLLSTYLSFAVLLLVGRKTTYWISQWRIAKKTKQNSIVLFGSKNNLSEVSDFLKSNISTETQQIIELEAKGVQLEELERINNVNPISEIFIPLSNYTENDIEVISNFCDNRFIRLRLIFDWKKVSARKLNLSRYNQTTVLKIALTPLDDQYNALIKRSFDLIFSLLLTILLFSWLFPILAIAVKLSSKGPVFFKQKRSGINNKGFNCYKFRSMRPNSEADNLQATQNDPRITKIGAFLRKTSLDELPQFINVIKGQMSIVGPRPHMLKHTEEYSNLVGNFMNRHAIKPGITGLAQIKGFRGEIDDFALLQNRVRLDRFYVNNWTVYFDIRIVLLTVFAIFKDHK